MKITSAEFVISVARPEQLPKGDFLEIAFAGRSNAGKSSLINKLVNRNNLARESASPGKTKQLNFYNINDEIFYVDLPGYGYASVSAKENRMFNHITDFYLNKREQLYLVILLLDIRHEPSKNDKMMIEWLGSSGLNYIVTVNKTDKLSKAQVAKNIEMIRKTGKIPDDIQIVPISCLNGSGIDALHEAIDGFVVEE
ncbi:MAG: YihA family ribosome biogenesis GTP-binding protein [Clostridia bacterium]|nr:YihA family ribosome biogenesis GTP-binding protein [Clostridia bacterium]